MPVKAVVYVLLASLALIPACGDSDETNETGGSLDADEITRSFESAFAVEADGDVTVDHSDTAELRVVELNQPDVSALRFFSIGLDQPVVTDSGTAIRFAVDLAGDYEGPGHYEISAAGETTLPSVDPDSLDPNPAASGLSKVFLEFNPEGNPLEDPALSSETQIFDKLARACTLDVGDGGDSGRLECPELSDAEGNTIALTVTWEAA